MSTKKAKGRSGPSGPSMTDNRRAEKGYGRLTIRMQQDGIDLLDAEAVRTGRPRVAILYELITRHIKRRA